LMSALPPKAGMAQGGFDVCFVPQADIGSLKESRRNSKVLAC
jgi:hypothetical protein